MTLLTHRNREGLVQLAVPHDFHLEVLVVDGRHQRFADPEAGFGAGCVDVDNGVRRPEVLGPPAHLRVADPVEPAGHRRDRRDVDGLLGHRLVGDRPLEVYVDRLGDADHRAVDRVEGWRQEHRLTDERCRVLSSGRALRDRQGRARQGVSRRERVGRRGRWWSRKRIGRRLRRRQFGRRRRRRRRRGGGGASGGGGGASGGGGGKGAAAGSTGAGGSGGGSGCASADGPPNTSPPTSPTAKIAATSLPLVRLRHTSPPVKNFVQCRTALGPATAREDRSAPTTARPNGAELLCSSPPGAQCYLRLVVKGTSKSPRFTATQVSAMTTRTVEAAIIAPTPASS